MRGEKYDEHLDGADPATDADAEAIFFGGGQRVATVLIYLNSVASGGCTRFGRLEPPLEVAPRRGMALVFFPGDRLGRLDGRCFHEATEAADTKWCAKLGAPASMPEAVVTIARNLSGLGNRYRARRRSGRRRDRAALVGARSWRRISPSSCAAKVCSSSR